MGVRKEVQSLGQMVAIGHARRHCVSALAGGYEWIMTDAKEMIVVFR